MNTETGGQNKERVIFLNNLIWRPELPNFKYKYELMSKYYRGEMYHFSSDYNTIQAEDFTFLSLPNSSGFFRYIRYSIFVLKNVIKDRDVKYVISYDPYIFCIIALIIKLLTGAKVIAEVNVNNFEGAKTTSKGLKLRLKLLFLKILTGFAIRRADGVKFITNKIYQYYNARFSFKKFTVFFSYISTHVFDITRCSDNNQILLVGHPYKIKGVDIMIKAFQLLSPKFPDVSLKIIGHCDNRKEYEDLAQENPRIIFQPGTEYDKIIAEFEGCKMVVAPSRTEAMSRVLLEAMACGKPVIGSRVGGIPEVITEDVDGLLFESENYEELAEKMAIILENPQLAGEFGSKARKKVENDFLPDKYVELYHSFLNSLK